MIRKSLCLTFGILLVLILVQPVSAVAGNILATEIKQVYGTYSSIEAVPVTFTLKNTRICWPFDPLYLICLVTAENVYVEACIRPSESMLSALPLSFERQTDSCCPGNYWCEGGEVSLIPGATETITLYPRAPGQGAVDRCGTKNYWQGPGQYDVILTSVDHCCVGPTGSPDCHERNPFGWKTLGGWITITGPDVCNYNSICEPLLGETVQNCPSDCRNGDGFDIIKWLMTYWWMIIVIVVISVGAILMFRRKRK